MHQIYLQQWNKERKFKNIFGKIQVYSKTTKRTSVTRKSGAFSLLPIGDNFMYIQTSSTSSIDESVFCRFERTDDVQINNITFYHNRFSVSTNDSIKSLGSFKIQLLFRDKTRSTCCNLAKNDRYRNSSAQ